jgi:hypothetical protein
MGGTGGAHRNGLCALQAAREGNEFVAKHC